jgi:hypothetical protein
MSERPKGTNLAVPEPVDDLNVNEPNGPGDLAHANLTDEVLEALAALDADASDHLDVMLQFGKTLSKAKGELKHGRFSLWCREALKRSPSWCSAYRRLHESRPELELALAWAAATGHRYANCRSVERLLRIVADWRKVTRGDGAAAPKMRRKKSTTIAHIELEEIAAQLRNILAEAEGALETFRYELWLTAPSDDGSAKEELMALVKRFRSRLHELAESCSALQVSEAVEAAAPPPIEDGPDAGLPQ